MQVFSLLRWVSWNTWCGFLGTRGVGFLEHVVSASRVLVDLGKVEAVMSWERPKSVSI